MILALLNAAARVQDMDFPGSRLHQLRGNREGLWSVTVSGNWRVTFRFSEGDVQDVDYLDYH
jgi:proteic killer suppression protein